MKQRKTEPRNRASAVHEVVRQRANKQPKAAVHGPAQAEPNALVAQDTPTPGDVHRHARRPADAV